MIKKTLIANFVNRILVGDAHIISGEPILCNVNVKGSGISIKTCLESALCNSQISEQAASALKIFNESKS